MINLILYDVNNNCVVKSIFSQNEKELKAKLDKYLNEIAENNRINNYGAYENYYSQLVFIFAEEEYLMPSLCDSEKDDSDCSENWREFVKRNYKNELKYIFEHKDEIIKQLPFPIIYNDVLYMYKEVEE